MPCLTKRFQTASEVLSQKYTGTKEKETFGSTGQTREEERRTIRQRKDLQTLFRTEDKYAKALSLYKDTALTLKEIAERTHVTAEGDLVLSAQTAYRLSEERAGLSSKAEGGLDFGEIEKRMKNCSRQIQRKPSGARENTPAR